MFRFFFEEMQHVRNTNVFGYVFFVRLDSDLDDGIDLNVEKNKKRKKIRKIREGATKA